MYENTREESESFSLECTLRGTEGSKKGREEEMGKG